MPLHSLYAVSGVTPTRSSSNHLQAQAQFTVQEYVWGRFVAWCQVPQHSCKQKQHPALQLKYWLGAVLSVGMLCIHSLDLDSVITVAVSLKTCSSYLAAQLFTARTQDSAPLMIPSSAFPRFVSFIPTCCIWQHGYGSDECKPHVLYPIGHSAHTMHYSHIRKILLTSNPWITPRKTSKMSAYQESKNRKEKRLSDGASIAGEELEDWPLGLTTCRVTTYNVYHIPHKWQYHQYSVSSSHQGSFPTQAHSLVGCLTLVVPGCSL